MAKHVSQCLCHQIVENAQDGIIYADSSGVIQVWNSGAQSIFGYSSEEALGETLDLIIQDKHRKQHWEGYRKVMKTGISSYSQKLLAVPSLRYISKQCLRSKIPLPVFTAPDTNRSRSPSASQSQKAWCWADRVK